MSAQRIRPWITALLLLPAALAAGAADPVEIPVPEAGKTAATVAAWSFEPNDIGDAFGGAASTAGDVNGDGYSDLIVGAHTADDGQGRTPGRAYVFLGGANGIDAAPVWTAQIGATGSEFGAAVAVAGDVNGDGFDDVIVGAPSGIRPGGPCGQPGGVAYLYHGGPNGPASNYSWADGVCSEIGARYGSAVAPAGDVNGDGFDDVLVGAYQLDSGAVNQGFAFLYLGSATGLGASPVWSVSGGSSSIALGISVGTAGDVNADGFADIIVGGTGGLGQARIYLGGPGGPSTFPQRTLFGDQNGAGFGNVVGPAGDVNGDGYADVVVSAPVYDYFGSDRGAVYVYPGSASGVDSTPLWFEYGNDTNSRFGSSVATAGDVNGDALADLIIGSTSWAAVGNTGGVVSLFIGYRGTGLLFHGWQILATQAAEALGSSVATAGDVNGDGYSDLLVGARGWTNGQLGEGRAQVFYGAGDAPRSYASWSNIGAQFDEGYAWSVAGAGDVNGDGYGDMLVGRPLHDSGPHVDVGMVNLYLGSPEGIGAPIWNVSGGIANQNLGVSVASAGDVNGDGFDDVVVGAHNINGAAGAVYAWHGTPNGLSLNTSWTVNGTEPGSYFGQSVAGAGDVNGDGFADVLVGAPNGGTDQEGRAHLYLGTASGLLTSPAWSIESDQSMAHLGNCVAGAGDINGDGYSDVVVAARDWDTAGPFSVVDVGLVRVYLGGPGGLSGTPITSIQGGSQHTFGSSVASAGDVDGDGYADIVVGASNYNPIASEGAAYVFRGGPGGLTTMAWWAQASGQSFSGYGASVAGGGDVNGDGLSDIVIGAVFFDAGNQDEGIARVYAGPLTGSAATTPISQFEGQGNFVNVGHVVAMVGDLNGDGFSDVASGAPGSTTNLFRDGKVVVVYGNGIYANGYSLPRRPRQIETSSSDPLALRNSLGSERNFRVEMLARSAAGRDRVRLQWEVKSLGQAFGGPVSTGPWQLAAAPGVNGPGAAISLQGLIGGLGANTTYQWRARTSGRSPYFPRSPWFSPQGNAPREFDLRTGSNPINTASGSNVVVQPADTQNGQTPATVSFAQVSSPGHTSLSSSPSGPPIPNYFAIGSVYYDISTTATYTGPVEICLHYDAGALAGPESDVRLMHFDSDLDPDAWVDATTSRDLVNDIVCGEVSHLSPFAIATRNPTSVEPSPNLPQAYALLGAAPNPFNPKTQIRYAVPAPGGKVTLRIYDVAGRLVRTLVESAETPGLHEASWDGRANSGARVASGVYLVHMVAPNYRAAQKLLLLK